MYVWKIPCLRKLNPLKNFPLYNIYLILHAKVPCCIYVEGCKLTVEAQIMKIAGVHHVTYDILFEHKIIRMYFKVFYHYGDKSCVSLLLVLLMNYRWTNKVSKVIISTNNFRRTVGLDIHTNVWKCCIICSCWQIGAKYCILTCKTNTMLNAILKFLFWTEKGWPTNFHSSTVSSNLLLVINEFGASISARVVGGSSLWK